MLSSSYVTSCYIYNYLFDNQSCMYLDLRLVMKNHLISIYRLTVRLYDRDNAVDRDNLPHEKKNLA